MTALGTSFFSPLEFSRGSGLTRTALGRVSRIADTERHRAFQLAKEVLAHVMQFRRSLEPRARCDESCSQCISPHLSKVTAAIEQRKPITFVLPAFPGKSPNRSKVLGPLPDMAERRALQFLGWLCDSIQERYSPGAQIILCSDGRVFSDVVGMKEQDVTAYQRELKRLIEELSPTHISTFDLDASYQGLDFNRMRIALMEGYGRSLESLKNRVRRGSQSSGDQESIEANRMYCGITRFLVEDSMFPGQTRSRTSIQKECRKRAYEVIRRSNAWSDLIAKRFPSAVRLSIHPQTCGAKKLGIRLMEGESWMTPWHGVAVNTGDRFILVKRAEAEEMGARLVHSPEGRPSHYEITA